ncbi:pentalenolactone synthase [Amycolatopsis arida]|uniref:Pentalenolactone synthase n=1 Tax=Amycolatopsis arida TaxID=587909 RepID=A0A1I5SIM8_9PSEU|nr:cytochrome P450 [Amycolatopsis arida]TDX96466.1 pentalenolactone synthase [Amycolatopsis arida]SFP70582.1 pentalenolactone synthase [Amycolatopsis arida]
MTSTMPRLPFDQPHPLAVSPILRALQDAGPVHKIHTSVGDEAWLVTDYAEARRLLSDDRLGRSHPRPETAARLSESVLFGGPVGDFATEHADHARMRALLQPHFSAKHLRALRPRVDALTTELLDALAAGTPPADLHEKLALPLPILVICELLGVPHADRDRFRGWTQAAADVRDRAHSEQGLAALLDYGRQLVVSKRRDPGDDVMSRICATEDVGDDEGAMLAMTLLFAGHETTVVKIGLGTLALLTNPDQWEALRRDPDLVPNAVEELLRTARKGGGGVPRYARTDLEVRGVPIRAGDLILLDLGAANHDPAVFTDPDRVDVTRPAAAHLAFGHGIRYCIGAPLARMELCAVFAQLVTRFPDMRLAVPITELALRNDVLAGGLSELPVTW